MVIFANIKKHLQASICFDLYLNYLPIKKTLSIFQDNDARTWDFSSFVRKWRTALSLRIGFREQTWLAWYLFFLKSSMQHNTDISRISFRLCIYRIFLDRDYIHKRILQYHWRQEEQIFHLKKNPSQIICFTWYIISLIKSFPNGLRVFKCL